MHGADGPGGARPLCRYALTGKEVQSILMQRLIKVDGKVRTDHTYPCGFMDVISIEKTDEYFRLVYDTKGRFVVHRITKEEAAYKLCKVRAASACKLPLRPPCGVMRVRLE